MNKSNHGTQLNRSGKIQDMPTISRERSFVRPQSYFEMSKNDKKKIQNQMIANMRGKPAMQIYQPPVKNTTGIPNQNSNMQKLNVHAKEFTMNNYELEFSRSNSNIPQQFQQQGFHNQLRHSKSSGNIMRFHHGNMINQQMNQMIAQQQQQQQSQMSNYAFNTQFIMTPQPHMQKIPLIQSASSGNILQGPRVHFQPIVTHPLTESEINRPSSLYYTSHVPQQTTHFVHQTNNFNNQNMNQKPKSVHYVRQQSFVNPIPTIQEHQQQFQMQIKRSKSMSSADSLANKLKSLNIIVEAPDLGKFPPEIEENIKIACEDPNKLNGRLLMDLLKYIMDRIIENKYYAAPGAKICIQIIEKEIQETFLESLLNTCQQWYQDRDTILRNTVTGDNSKFTAFIWFLTEMSSQIKRSELHKSKSSSPTENQNSPRVILLTLLVKCCQACVQPPKSLTEVECLFFVLTSIGKELEAELPNQLDLLLESVRDGFLQCSGLPQIRKTLLQLIELKASNWQLPGSTVLYYYPNIK